MYTLFLPTYVPDKRLEVDESSGELFKATGSVQLFQSHVREGQDQVTTFLQPTLN